MILYFSGTGNSLYAARRLADLTGDSVRPLLSLRETPLEKGEAAVGIVFPVYAWGMPRIVERVLREAAAAVAAAHYIYIVCTCGDDIGMTDVFVNNLLKPYGRRANAVFSVQMRNTYVCLPGFDVDSEETERRKTAAAHARLEKIAVQIRARQSGLTEVVRGAMPRMKSYVLRPLFNRFLTGDRRFKTKHCVGCKHCAAVCPAHNIISNKKGKPKWQGHCYDCLACYHACPHHAIRYGRYTKGKGQVRVPFNGE